MPELPEVETIRRQLAPALQGADIVEAGSYPSKKFTPATAATGSTIADVGRRGKFLLFYLGANDLIIHLGMTGRLGIVDQDDRFDHDDRYLRAWWRLGDGRTLRLDDVRRFGRVRMVPAGDFSSIPTLASAGPEPFDPELTDEVFWGRLKTSRRMIKTQLLSQRPVAGVGNIYADEALWLARINPKTRALGIKRAGRLLAALREVLAQGIENGGTTLRDYRNAEGEPGSNQVKLTTYGRGGHPCLVCGEPLRSGYLDNRSTVWCPSCQAR